MTEPVRSSRHETSGASVLGILAVGVGLAVMLGVIAGGLYGWKQLLEWSYADEVPAANMQPDTTPPLYDQWRRDTAPLAELREQARSRLTGYGWVDEDAEVARIPIDVAMQVLAHRHAVATKETP